MDYRTHVSKDEFRDWLGRLEGIVNERNALLLSTTPQLSDSLVGLGLDLDVDWHSPRRSTFSPHQKVSPYAPPPPPPRGNKRAAGDAFALDPLPTAKRAARHSDVTRSESQPGSESFLSAPQSYAPPTQHRADVLWTSAAETTGARHPSRDPCYGTRDVSALSGAVPLPTSLNGGRQGKHKERRAELSPLRYYPTPPRRLSTLLPPQPDSSNRSRSYSSSSSSSRSPIELLVQQYTSSIHSLPYSS